MTRQPLGWCTAVPAIDPKCTSAFVTATFSAANGAVVRDGLLHGSDT
jgi:hypothetical protein